MSQIISKVDFYGLLETNEKFDFQRTLIVTTVRGRKTIHATGVLKKKPKGSMRLYTLV